MTNTRKNLMNRETEADLPREPLSLKARRDSEQMMQSQINTLIKKNEQLERQIEEYRRSEETLRQNEERYRTLLDNIDLGIAWIGADYRIIFTNDVHARMFQKEREDFTGRECFREQAGRSSVCPRCPGSRAMQSGMRAESESAGVRADGSRFTIRLTAYPTFAMSGNVSGFVEIIEDISDRRGIEEQLRESEEKYRTLVESILDLIFTVDRRGRFTYINPNFEKVTGYGLADLRGCPFTTVIAPEYRIQSEEYFRRGIRGESIPPYEVDMVHKDGSRIPIEFLVATLYDTQRRPVGRIGIGRNITERRQVEEEKKMLERQLLQAQKMEAVGTLAGGIAHDFNNLLMGIQGCASLMLFDMDPCHPCYDKLKLIEEQVRSGADLTRQLLGFARGGKYQVKPADLNEIMKKTSTMFGRTKKEVAIHQKYEKKIWTVEVDQGQIEQVLLNLYVNAWQAMPGGGDLYLETANVILDDLYVKPYYVKPGGYVKMSVTDTGVGMDERTRQRIFEPFFTTKEMRRGTGLGLASAYGIIKGHGGHINVYSEKGTGTTFNVYLPASSKEIVQEIHQKEKIVKGTETILLVDDEDTIIEVSKEILEALGYRVLVARSGQEAVNLYRIRKAEIDLVILDMIMPEMGGGETFDHLKLLNPDIRVILSSGYSLNEQATGIIERGCRAFIQKPFSMSEVSQKVRGVLDQEGI